MDILQQFFEHNVACAPYKPNAFLTFARILTVPSRVLKDFIRLMKLDLVSLISFHKSFNRFNWLFSTVS